MRTTRRIVRNLSDHELLAQVAEVFVGWRFGDLDPFTAEARWDALLREMTRRERKDLWRGCTCEECFTRFTDTFVDG